MYTARLTLEVVNGDNKSAVRSDLMTAAGKQADLMDMVTTMLITHADKLVAEIREKLPELDAPVLPPIQDMEKIDGPAKPKKQKPKDKDDTAVAPPAPPA